jgi:hypothetical protein
MRFALARDEGAASRRWPGSPFYTEVTGGDLPLKRAHRNSIGHPDRNRGAKARRHFMGKRLASGQSNDCQHALHS